MMDRAPLIFTRFQVIVLVSLGLACPWKFALQNPKAPPATVGEPQPHARVAEAGTLAAGVETIMDDQWDERKPSRDLDLIADVTNTLNASSPLGMNISHLSYYSTEWPLLDVMKTSGGWYTQKKGTWDTGERDSLLLDEDGWVMALPREDDTRVAFRWVAALILNGTGGRYPAGTYTVYYQGGGRLEYGNDAVKDEALSRPGRDVIRVEKPGDGGILLRITEIDPAGTGDYPRDIHVIMPGGLCGGNPFVYCAPDGGCPARKGCLSFARVWQRQIFHPLFLENLRAFKVIRMMDFLRTNTSKVTAWSDRPRWSDARWNGENGAPPELALELAVRLNADPWLNMPARADDEYVESLALLARQRLQPGQKVYVEYANEIWNTAFSAGDWVQRRAEAAWPASNASGYTKRINGYGVRAAEVARIWKRVWGEERGRVIAVMGAQGANPWAAAEALGCPLYAESPGGTACASVMDALAIAPYFGAYLGGGEHAPLLTRREEEGRPGLDSLFQELATGGKLAGSPLRRGALAAVEDWIEQHAAIAERYELDLLAYEGGQHLVGVGSELEDGSLSTLFIQANRDPRMYDLYRELLAVWREHGGGLFCHFLSVGAYTKYGSWGAKEHQGQQGAPKYRALMDFIAENPCWWQGCAR